MAIDADKQEVTLATVWKSCSAEIRGVARMWFYYTLFYWMFPTIAVIFGLFIAKRQIKWLDLVVHGEFLIYAITIVAGSTRLIAKDLRDRGPFVNRQAFNLVSHIMIFPAIFTYGLLRYIGITSDPYSVNKPLVVTYSILLLVAAFVFSYVVFLIDAQRSAPYDLPRRTASAILHSPDQLNTDFNALQAHDKSTSAGDNGGSPPPAPETPTVQQEEALPAPDPIQEKLDGHFDAIQDDPK